MNMYVKVIKFELIHVRKVKWEQIATKDCYEAAYVHKYARPRY